MKTIVTTFAILWMALQTTMAQNWHYIGSGGAPTPVTILNNVNGFKYRVITFQDWENGLGNVGDLQKAPVSTENWVVIPKPATQAAQSLNANTSGHIFLTVGQQVYVSTNNAVNWTSLNFDVDLSDHCLGGIDFWCGVAPLNSVFFDLKGELVVSSTGAFRSAISHRYYKQTGSSFYWANLQWPTADKTIKTNEQITYYSQVYVKGVTEAQGQGANVQVWIGYSNIGTIHPSNPSDFGYTWVPASFHGDRGNNDEYKATLSGIEPGLHKVAAKVQIGTNLVLYGCVGGTYDPGVHETASLTVEALPGELIGWCNLQWPEKATITGSETATFYAQAWVKDKTKEAGATPGLEGWIGYNEANVGPEQPGWTWVPATFHGDRNNNDEFKAGISGLAPKRYYVLSRFRINGGSYAYGGFSQTGGGFWPTGSAAILDVVSSDAKIGWCNVQWPEKATITGSETATFYAQAWVKDKTKEAGATPGLEGWIGYNEANVGPEQPGWTWVPATFHGDRNNNDEFKAGITGLAPKRYYILSRFRINGGSYAYGGFSQSGGGFWPAGSAAILEVVSSGAKIDWCNLQWPGNATIVGGGSATFYAQVWVKDKTKAAGATPGLEAWIGYNDANVGPEQTGWTWLPATFNGDRSNNDEFKAAISGLAPQRYYVLSRFRIDGGSYAYGGFSQTGGGFWPTGNTAVLDVLSAGAEPAETRSGFGMPETEATMSQNYPNPFADATTINITVGEDVEAKIIIRDVLGQVVQDIVLDGSTNQIHVNASDLKAGTYFYTLLVNGAVKSVNKMTVVK